jgi:catechol 2,3-dioxygenase-like lactoylglutathione lyase family enzyme
MVRHRLAVGVIVVAAALGCGAGERSALHEAALAIAHDSELSAAIPIFNVADLRASQRYYRDVLGFKLDWEDGDPPDFGAVSRGHAVVFMCQGCQGHPGAWIMLFTPDVDRLHQEFVDTGAVVKRPPTNMPWHLREMLVEDLDGNTMRFASPIEH